MSPKQNLYHNCSRDFALKGGIKTEKQNFKNWSELVLIKQNIGISGGDSTPPEVKSLNLLLIEMGVLYNR